MKFKSLVLKALVAILKYIAAEAKTLNASREAHKVEQLIEEALKHNDY